MYNKTVMDHFRNPRNVGVIEDANGVGEVGNPLCGDMMTIYLKIENEHIEDIKFQTFGCGSAIAVSSMLTEIAKGKTVEEAKKNHQQGRGPSPGRPAQKQTALLQSGSGRPADGH
jgi:nitrogen fixation NifU-like protein